MPKSNPAKVLFVDDDALHTRALLRSLENLGTDFETVTAETVAQAEQVLSSSTIDVAVVDLTIDSKLGPSSGYSLISRIIALDPNIRIIVVTGHEASKFGIEAINRGASSFLEKPVEPSHLLALIKDGISCSEIKRAVRVLESEVHNALFLEGVQSKSSLMLKALSLAWRAARTSQSVLILGETGTGKGVLANSIHQQSSRKGRTCARFQPSFSGIDLISSELFGHTKGAFTGAVERRGLLELCDKGTLFIDEVDQLPHELQVILLGVIQDRVFKKIGSERQQSSDFRLISATNRSRTELLGKDALREDFYHRIAQVVIELPSLRQRAEDIPELAQHFCFKLTTRENLQVQGITREAVLQLQAYDWPGNIRELQAVIENACYKTAFEERSFIEPQDIEIAGGRSARQPIENLDSSGPFRERVQEFENRLVLESLKACDDNQSKAAIHLQLDRSSFRRILARARGG